MQSLSSTWRAFVSEQHLRSALTCRLCGRPRSSRVRGGPNERTARYAFFAFDTAASVMVALAPLASGDDIPQNLVFLSSRPEYYYALVALSVLALSPALVLWTGLCAVTGLAVATAWIMAGWSARGPRDLPAVAFARRLSRRRAQSRFPRVGFRVNQAVVVALVTAIAALAVHSARNMVRAHAAAEAERTRIQRIFGRYVPAQVAEQLIKAGQLAPQQREASIIFADIEGFTRLSETLRPLR